MKRLPRASVLWLLGVSLALAGGSYDQFLASLSKRESGGKADTVNYAGYAGLYQMGEGALVDAGYYQRDGTKKNDWRGTWTGKNGINNLSDFLHNPTAQKAAIEDYHATLWRQIQAKGLDRTVGQTFNGQTITESGLIGGAHLIGAGGLRQCLNAGRGCTDGLGTTAASYMSRFGGFDVAPVTGRAGRVTPGGGSGGLGGAGTGSTGGVTGGDSPATPSLGALAPDVTPQQAFTQTTGLKQSDVSTTGLALLSMTALTWLAWVALAQYLGWRQARWTFMDMQTQIIKSSVIVLVVLGIVLA